MKEITSKDLWEQLKRKLRRSYVKKVKKVRKKDETPPKENDVPRVTRTMVSPGTVTIQ